MFYFKNTGYVETIACCNIYPLKHNQVIFPIYKDGQTSPRSVLVVTHSQSLLFLSHQSLAATDYSASVYLPNLDISHMLFIMWVASFISIMSPRSIMGLTMLILFPFDPFLLQACSRCIHSQATPGLCMNNSHSNTNARSCHLQSMWCDCILLLFFVLYVEEELLGHMVTRDFRFQETGLRQVHSSLSSYPQSFVNYFFSSIHKGIITTPGPHMRHTLNKSQL